MPEVVEQGPLGFIDDTDVPISGPLGHLLQCLLVVLVGFTRHAEDDLRLLRRQGDVLILRLCDSGLQEINRIGASLLADGQVGLELGHQLVVLFFFGRGLTILVQGPASDQGRFGPTVEDGRGNAIASPAKIDAHGGELLAGTLTEIGVGRTEIDGNDSVWLRGQVYFRTFLTSPSSITLPSSTTGFRSTQTVSPSSTLPKVWY